MKAIKAVKIVMFVIVVLIVGLAVLVGLFGKKAMKTGVEIGATKALKVPVTVEGTSLSILAGSAGVKNLVVANPPGYQNKTMLELGDARVDLELGSVLTDTVRIDDILLENVTVTLEQKGLTNNIQEVLNGMSGEAPKPKPQKEEKPSKDLLIKHLLISDVAVKVKLLPVPGKSDTITMKLAPIEMNDVGSKDKVDVAVLSSKVLLAIIGGIAQQGVGILPEDIIGPLGDTLKGLGAAAQTVLKETGKVLEGGKEATEKVLEGTKKAGEDLLKKAGEDLKKGLGGLLPKKEEQ